MKINVNGIWLYYQKIGQGEPLIFLHGNGEDHQIFNKLILGLEKRFTIYLIDSRNHGLSDKTNVYNYHVMSEDISMFIMKLKLKNVSLFGFSDGAIIGIMIASKHPGYLARLVIAGANLYPKGIKPNALKDVSDEYLITRDPLLKMMLTLPELTKKDLAKISIPVLVLAGEFDVITQRHTALIHHNLVQSTLKVIKKHNHDSYIINTDFLKDIINEFL